MPLSTLANPLRGVGLDAATRDAQTIAQGEIERDGRAAAALYQHCPAAHETPLSDQPSLAGAWGVAVMGVKLEDQRMGLGSFKALGAAHAIAKRAAEKCDPSLGEAMATALAGETFICASAGNHGLSVAAGARLFGAEAVVILAETVPEAFAERLREKGARVIRHGEDYEQGMEHSRQLARDNGWFLLSDGSWQGYSDPARDVMEGYLIMGMEAARQWDAQYNDPPTHVMLQAGVGGLAAACASAARTHWGEDVTLVVVEPEAAPALMESVRAGGVVDTEGPVSSMGRLDCKTPSHLALKYLAEQADFFVTLDDGLVEGSVAALAQYGLKTTPSGGAGLAAVQHGTPSGVAGLGPDARVLCYLSEGAV